MSVAQTLDAADGVMDGKFHGVPIVETSGVAPIRHVSRAAYASSAYGSSAAQAIDAADGVIDGTYFGRPIVENTRPTYSRSVSSPHVIRNSYPVGGYRSSAALALVAADGVIDGRYHGRDIVENNSRVISRGVPTNVRGSYYGSGYNRSRSSTAVDLDAADGVIDGKFYGREIIDGGHRTSAIPSTTYGYGGLDGAYGRRVIPSVGSSRVFGDRLDRYDSGYYGAGVIDAPYTSTIDDRHYGTSVLGGRYDSGYYGGRVIEEAPYTTSLVDDRYYGSTYGDRGYGSSYGSRFVDGANYGSRFVDGASYGSRVVDGANYGSRFVDGPSYGSRYLDGARYGSRVVDGASYGSRFVDGASYGSRVVDAPAYRSVYPSTMNGRTYAGDSYVNGGVRRVVSGTGFRSSAATALDAADGVMDGKYHGRDIVEVTR